MVSFCCIHGSLFSGHCSQSWAILTVLGTRILPFGRCSYDYCSYMSFTFFGFFYLIWGRDVEGQLDLFASFEPPRACVNALWCHAHREVVVGQFVHKRIITKNK